MLSRFKAFEELDEDVTLNNEMLSELFNISCSISFKLTLFVLDFVSSFVSTIAGGRGLFEKKFIRF